jgi:hypothetical protein
VCLHNKDVAEEALNRSAIDSEDKIDYPYTKLLLLQEESSDEEGRVDSQESDQSVSFHAQA